MKANTRRMVLAALMAALVMAGSALRITLPTDIAGTTSFHLGNIMCALAGILLGPGWGAAAAGVGSMLYDWTNPLYFSDSWITLLTKALYGLAAGLVARAWKKPCYGRDLTAAAAGAAAYGAVYLLKTFLYTGLLVHGLTADAAWLTVIAKLPATLFNAVVAVVCAPLLAGAIRAALNKSGLRLPD